MDGKVYVYIDEHTVKQSLGRVYQALDTLTDGRAEMAIEMVKEYNDLKAACEEIQKDKERTAAKEN